MSEDEDGGLDDRNRDDIRFARQFERLEQISPRATKWLVRFLRRPYARFVRIPLGLLLIVGGVFSFLPVLGFWMLPFGLFLLAVDVPFLRRPVSRFIIWAERWWIRWKQRKKQKDNAGD